MIYLIAKFLGWCCEAIWRLLWAEPKVKPWVPPPPEPIVLSRGPKPVGEIPVTKPRYYSEGWKSFKQVKADLEAIPEFDNEDAERLRQDVIEALKRLDERHEGAGSGLYKGEASSLEAVK